MWSIIVRDAYIDSLHSANSLLFFLYCMLMKSISIFHIIVLIRIFVWQFNFKCNEEVFVSNIIQVTIIKLIFMWKKIWSDWKRINLLLKDKGRSRFELFTGRSKEKNTHFGISFRWTWWDYMSTYQRGPHQPWISKFSQRDIYELKSRFSYKLFKNIMIIRV